MIDNSAMVGLKKELDHDILHGNLSLQMAVQLVPVTSTD